jgi:hypothetical protein
MYSSWRAEEEMASRRKRWGSASYLDCPPMADTLLLGEPFGDVGDDPARSAHRQRRAELKR